MIEFLLAPTMPMGALLLLGALIIAMGVLYIREHGGWKAMRNEKKARSQSKSVISPTEKG